MNASRCFHSFLCDQLDLASFCPVLQFPFRFSFSCQWETLAMGIVSLALCISCRLWRRCLGHQRHLRNARNVSVLMSNDTLSVSLRTHLSCLNSQGKQNIKVGVDLEILTNSMLSVNVFYRSGNVLQDLYIPVWFPCSYEIYVDVIGKHRSAAHLPCSFMMHVSRVPG